MKRILCLFLAVLLFPLMALADRGIQVDALWNGLRDTSGNPLASGKVYTYDAGTTTARALYTAQDKTTSATNPIILDANGRSLVYGDATYKFVVKDSDDVTLYTMDNLFYQLDDLTPIWAGTSTGSADAYAVSPSPAVTSYTDGLQVTFISNFENSGASTLNVSSLGAKAIKTVTGSDLSAADIASGQLVNVIYIDGSPGTFRLIGQSGTIPVSGGGTGASTAAGARANLSAAVSGANGDITSLTALTDITYTSATSGIYPDTSDGSDSKAIQIGNASTSRGGYAYFAGNEHASVPGDVAIVAGGVSGGDVTISTQTTEAIKFKTNNTQRWWILSTGVLEPQTTNTYDIGSSGGKVKDIYLAGKVLQTLNTWTPTITANGGGSISGTTVDEATYTVASGYVNFRVAVSFTLTGASTTAISLTHPIAGTGDDVDANFICSVTEGGTHVSAGGLWRYDGTYLYVTKPSLANFTAGTITINIDGKYKY